MGKDKASAKRQQDVCFSVNVWVCSCGLYKKNNEWAKKLMNIVFHKLTIVMLFST